MLFESMAKSCGFQPVIVDQKGFRVDGEPVTGYTVKNPDTGDHFYLVGFADGLFSIAAEMPAPRP